MTAAESSKSVITSLDFLWIVLKLDFIRGSFSSPAVGLGSLYLTASSFILRCSALCAMSQWGPLINSDKSPTPLLEQLCLGIAQLIVSGDVGPKFPLHLTQPQALVRLQLHHRSHAAATRDLLSESRRQL